MPNTRNLLFETIEERVRAYIGHPHLRACQVPQTVSRFHFDVANAVMVAADVKEATAEGVLEAVLLLEQGLSMHDDVDARTGALKQLTVLAGDYNSSQYYYILARLGDFELMHHLSEAIVRINEAKMKLRQFEDQVDSETYFNLEEIIQGDLLVTLAEHYLGADSASVSYIHSLVKAYVLQGEMAAYSAPRFFTFRQAYDWLSDSLERVRTMPSNSLVGPIYNFLVEYFLSIQNKLETLNFAEGNR
jgi:heptaprenyl diphosphate synthase